MLYLTVKRRKLLVERANYANRCIVLPVDVRDFFADVVDFGLKPPHPLLEVFALTPDAGEFFLLRTKLCFAGVLLGGKSRRAQQHGDGEESGAPQMRRRWLHTEVALPSTPMSAPQRMPITMRRGSKNTSLMNRVSMAR